MTAPTVGATRFVGSADVVRTTGVTYRQLDYWARAGYVLPAESRTQHAVPQVAANAAAPGSGRVRVWDETEVAVVQTMVDLTAWGLAPSAAADAARALVTNGTAKVAPTITLARVTA